LRLAQQRKVTVLIGPDRADRHDNWRKNATTKVFVVVCPDGSKSGWNQRTWYEQCVRYFASEQEALAYDKKTSPGYPGKVEKVTTSD
jgi:hypothetical protein